jgi:hypothetical protein
MVSFRSLLPLAFVAVAYAAPLAERSVTALSSTTINSYKPYTYYAGAAYCKPANTLAWNCGANCNANAGFKPVASGGDGSTTQYWYVGYDSTLKTVIVGHQGTDASKLEALLTDANIDKEPLSSSLFPGLPSGIEAHQGFAESHARSASAVLAAVQKAMSTYGATSVTTVGHSLGGALALLEAVYLPLHLPSTTKFKTYLFGTPRVGNDAFATYVDSHASVVRITNKKDIIPIVPGRFLGFSHPSGENHIQESGGAWVACSGRENEESGCTISDVPNIFVGDLNDHGGPYNGIHIGC